MDQSPSRTDAGLDAQPAGPSRAPAPARKRSTSGASGLLSKIPFVRSTGEHRSRPRRNTNETDPFVTIPADHVAPFPSSSPEIDQLQTFPPQQQQKTRRRRGSLRKVALLGRGAQRERRESRPLATDTQLEGNRTGGTSADARATTLSGVTSGPVLVGARPRVSPIHTSNGNDPSSFGLGISDLTPRASMEGYALRHDNSSTDSVSTPTATASGPRKLPPEPRPSISYSTTDDEDALHMARPPPNTAPLLSSSNPYSVSPPHINPRPPQQLGNNALASAAAATSPAPPPTSLLLHHRRSSTNPRAKSPLALTSLVGTAASSSAPPVHTHSAHHASGDPLNDDGGWDYAETAWWGWIILFATWAVFVVGMGSCLGVWSWAWDVGTTPYAPPELEDDPTLPIVGYYPALMILTGVMAWVWVVVAWVGMKYFRHAQVSGD